jgi:hypothetical protein
MVASGLAMNKVRYQRRITQWAHGVTAISDLDVKVGGWVPSLKIQEQLALGDARSVQRAIKASCYRSHQAGARAFLGVVILAVGCKQALVACGSRDRVRVVEKIFDQDKVVQFVVPAMVRADDA